MRYVLALIILAFGTGGPAHADWPTTNWIILEDYDHKHPILRITEPVGTNARIAAKHRAILKRSSLWFQSMSFSAPKQLTDIVDGKKYYVAFLNSDMENQGSSHTENGYTKLSSHSGFLTPYDLSDHLLQAAAVHELFHSIQYANPAYHKLASLLPRPVGPPTCEGDIELAWLTEGTASAVQIQYLERVNGYEYGHAFHGSPRLSWVRHFDQPLHWGRLPHEKPATVPGQVKTTSWMCSYGTWYFWYAVGNMLGSKDPGDLRRTAYLRYIFDHEGPWHGTGLAMADEGLRRAARGLDAARPYHGGFYGLYPQFVAQYLDVDDFYEQVQDIVVSSPSLYETSSTNLSDPIEEIAARAWRVRVQIPPDVTHVPHTLRFVLEAPTQTTLDNLHLIVDKRVIVRPDSPGVPYSHTRQLSMDTPNSDGEFEYFVRIANVAKNALDTRLADYTLRVEVQGFYGEVNEPSNDDIAGQFPPGFQITGPDAEWTCSGGDDARATFMIVTPDGMADQLERVLPQGLLNIESDLDRAEMSAHERGGHDELQRTRQDRKAFESGFQALFEGSGAQEEIARAANEQRLKQETTIVVKLYGTNSAGACDVMLSMTMPGRQAMAGVLDDNQFSVIMTPEAMGNMLSDAMDLAPIFDFEAMLGMTEDQLEQQGEHLANLMRGIEARHALTDLRWTQCGKHDKECDAGTLSLEKATHEHVSGFFRIPLYRGDLQRVVGAPVEHPREYAEVRGYFNITSSQADGDNAIMDFVSRGERKGEPLYMPGIERLLQGGSLFGK